MMSFPSRDSIIAKKQPTFKNHMPFPQPAERKIISDHKTERKCIADQDKLQEKNSDQNSDSY